MAQKIVVQDGIIEYSASDSTVDVNVSINGNISLTKDLTVRNITSHSSTNLVFTSDGNINLISGPSGAVLINNVPWSALQISSNAVNIASSAASMNFTGYGFNATGDINGNVTIQSLPTRVVPIGLDPTGTISATTIIQSYHDQLVALGGGTIYLPPGIYLIGGIGLLWHPSVNLHGSQKGDTVLQCGNNLGISTGPDGVSSGIRTMIYILARAQGVAASTSWNPEFYHLIMTSNKGIQSNNAVSALWFEVGHNDPQYSHWAPSGDAKCYSAGNIDDCEIYSFSGLGVWVGADRQRLRWTNSRSINHGIISGSTVITSAAGLKVQGNDPVITGGGFGGCTETNVAVAGCSGLIFSHNNVWFCDSNIRSNTALAMVANNLNGCTIVNNVFNDTLYLKGGSTNEDRAVTVTGNDFRPNKVNFTSNGVPVGTASNQFNCHIAAEGYDMIQVTGNVFDSASSGNTYNNILTCENGAGVMIDIMASTDPAISPGITPWATTNAVPVVVDGTSTCFYTLADKYQNYKRLSGPLVLGAADPYTVEPNYSVIIGGGTTDPVLVKTDTYFQKQVSLPYSLVTMTEAGSSVIGDSASWVRYFANTTLTAYQITLPADPNDGHSVTLKFQQYVAGVTLLPNSGQTLYDPLPGSTTVIPGNSYTYIYDLSRTGWYLRDSSAALPITDTWSNINSINGYPNQRAYVTNLGYGNLIPFVYNNSLLMWKPMGLQVVSVSDTIVTGTTTVSEQLVTNYLLPVGLLYKQTFKITVGFGKTGTTDAVTAFGIRIGTNGILTDTSLIVANSPLSSSQKSTGFEYVFESTSGTVLRKMGTQSGSSSFSGAASTTVASATTTGVPSMITNPLYISLTATMAGTTDSPVVAYFKVELL